MGQSQMVSDLKRGCHHESMILTLILTRLKRIIFEADNQKRKTCETSGASESVSTRMKLSLGVCFSLSIILPGEIPLLGNIPGERTSQNQNLSGAISLCRAASRWCLWVRVGVVLACRWLLLSQCFSRWLHPRNSPRVLPWQGSPWTLPTYNESGSLQVGPRSFDTFNQFPQVILLHSKVWEIFRQGLTEVVKGHFRGRTISMHAARERPSFFLGHVAWQMSSSTLNYILYKEIVVLLLKLHCFF